MCVKHTCAILKKDKDKQQMSGIGAFIPFVVVVFLLALAWVTCHYSHTHIFDEDFDH